MAASDWRMVGRLRAKPRKARQLADRILEGMREIGVLLLVFAPLDVALSRTPLRELLGTLLLFVGIGTFLVSAAPAFEWRRDDDE